MGSITCKFGGTSLADSERIQRAVGIIQADPRRRFVVPSAPGKRTDEDKKITDVFFGWFHMLQDGLNPSQPIEIIRERFASLASELDVSISIDAELDAIAQEATGYEVSDFLASRGEYLNALILAELLDATLVDPTKCISFDYEGRLNPESYDRLGDALTGDGLFVVPGFYGVDPDGRVRTFGRGGSDVTGAVVARASGSELYENWTDVSGIRMTDPRIVPEAQRIDQITYKELRELAYMGASVLHDEAIFPLRDVGIPINIRNTNDPDNPGTMIVAERETDRPVCGIAARAGFTMINVEKNLMNLEIGFARRMLSVLEEHQIAFEHMPSGIDTISVIVNDDELNRHANAVAEAIGRRCEADNVSVSPGLALIATVGQAMNHHIGVAARLLTALAEAQVNVRVLDQGSSEMNIIIGVEEADMDRAVRAIYHAFAE